MVNGLDLKTLASNILSLRKSRWMLRVNPGLMAHDQ